MLTLQVTNQSIKVIDATPLGSSLVAGTIKEYQCKFQFDDSWEGYAKTAYFLTEDDCNCKDYSKAIPIPLGMGDVCDIPAEVLRPGARIRIGVNGVKSERVRPTVYTSPMLVRIGATGNIPCPDSDTYEHIIQIVEEAKEIAQSIRNDADAGLFDGREVIQADIAPISKTEAEWNNIGAYGKMAEFAGIQNANEYRVDDIAMIAGVVSDRDNAVSMLFIRITNVVAPDSIKGVSIGMVWGKPGKGVASGGKTGQILFKKSDKEYDTQWGDVPTHTWDEILDKPFKVLNLNELEVIEDALGIKAVEMGKVTGLNDALDTKLEGVKVNGSLQMPVNHVVDVTVPTKVSQLENDNNYATQTELKDGLDEKVSTISVNGVDVPKIGSNVNINVPTKIGELENDTGYLTEATIPAEYVTDSELQPKLDEKLDLTGGTMAGKINMANFGINNLPKAIKDDEAVNYGQLKEAIGGYLQGKNLLQTTGSETENAMSQDAVTKELNKKAVKETVDAEFVKVNQAITSNTRGVQANANAILNTNKNVEANKKAIEEKVAFVTQSLNTNQKKQARANIEASTYTVIRRW